MVRAVLEIEVLEISPGRLPFEEWLESLDVRSRAIVVQRLDRLSIGVSGDVKALGGGIFELRIHFGPGFRVYFVRNGPNGILVIYGGTKSTQVRDIRKSKKIWANCKREKYEA